MSSNILEQKMKDDLNSYLIGNSMFLIPTGSGCVLYIY